jgi:hypothetical protein
LEELIPNKPILIAGAGIGGLVAALALKLFISNNPRQPISMSIAAAATFHGLRDVGHAVEEVDAEGTVCWRATPKFLRETGLEPGPLIRLGPDVH